MEDRKNKLVDEELENVTGGENPIKVDRHMAGIGGGWHTAITPVLANRVDATEDRKEQLYPGFVEEENLAGPVKIPRF